MANDYNNVTIVGRMTKDPEVETTKSGTSMVRFSIASNYYGGKGKENEVSFFNCVAWGKLADIIAQWMKKGKQLLVGGEIRQNRWQAKDGSNRSDVQIVVDTIQMLGGGKDTEEGEKTPSTPQKTASEPVSVEKFNDDEVPF